MNQPLNVLFREIHKNAWLKKLPSTERRNGAFPKRGERVWVVFCVHDDSEAFLEVYTDQKLAVTHKPDWFVSLNNCLHISPTICAQEDEYEFVITLSSDVIRLAAPSWEMMMEWVETIRSKLQEMRILSPRENLYSKMPEVRLPLAPTRDPNSPLPPTPVGPSSLVPGIEPVRSDTSDGSGTTDTASTSSAASSSSSSSSVGATASSSSSSVTATGLTVTTAAAITTTAATTNSVTNLSADAAAVPRTVNNNVNVEVRTSTALYITHSEPAVYTRPRHSLNRAASVPEPSSTFTASLVTPPHTRNSPSSNVTVIEVSSASHSAVPLETTGVFNFNLVQNSLNSVQNPPSDYDPALQNRLVHRRTSEGNSQASPTGNSRQQVTPVAVNSEDGASGETPRRNGSHRRTLSGSLQDLSDVSGHYECVFLPAQSPSLQQESGNGTSISITPRSRSTESNPSHAAFSRTPPISHSSEQNSLGSQQELASAEATGSVVQQRRRSRSTSLSEGVLPQVTRAAGERGERGERNRGVPNGVTPLRTEGERRLQPAPHPYRQAGTSVAVDRLTLREQQVLQLRREMLHPGGVRLQLRRKDCTNSIALVDAFGAVWVAGWKQKEHPMLYNALHIGDQLISVCGVLVQSASDAQKLIRGATSLYVEFVIRRVPCGRVFAIRRDTEGQNLGIVQESNTAEIRDVMPGSPAARHGLAPRAQTCDGLSLTNWILTEINGRPLNLFFKDGEVRDRLNAVGRDISILVQPADLVKQLKKQLKAIRGYKDYIVQ